MRGDEENPMIMLKLIASQNLWKRYAFFGSNKNLDILYQSPLFKKKVHGTTTNCPFHVNVVKYKCRYYLVDVIYLI